MKNKLAYSPEALADLDEIWDYICAESGEPDIASNVVESILDTIDQLQDFAQMGAQVSANAGMLSDYRYLVCGQHLAFYRVAGHDIYIDRVLHSRRDYIRVLFGVITQNDMD